MQIHNQFCPVAATDSKRLGLRLPPESGGYPWLQPSPVPLAQPADVRVTPAV